MVLCFLLGGVVAGAGRSHAKELVGLVGEGRELLVELHLLGLGLRQERTDRLGGILEGGIVQAHHRVGDHRHHRTGQSAPGQFVTQCLDEHVADRALGVGHRIVDGNRVDLGLGEFGATQDEAHLRAVAMGDNEFPALLDHVDERRHRPADRLVLLRDGVMLGVGDQSVAAEGDDRGAQLSPPSPLASAAVKGAVYM